MVANSTSLLHFQGELNSGLSEGVFNTTLQVVFTRVALALAKEYVPSTKAVPVLMDHLVSERAKQMLAFSCAMFGATMFLLRCYNTGYDFVVANFTCSVTLGPFEETKGEVLEWCARNLPKQLSRNMVLEHIWTDGTPELEFVIGLGTHRFHFQGTLFSITRMERKTKITDTRGSGVPDVGGEMFVVSCLGRNPGILKAFLQECKAFAKSRQGSKTLIYRLNNRGKAWTQFSKPSRPMSTVDLDECVKADLLADASRYFHPSAKKYYANRGIPLRRGFLFHGPPGCGKSSISQALAGHFMVPLYVLSLSNPSMTDSTLEHLLRGSPERCIVLIEDVDSAGIERESMKAQSTKPSKGQTKIGDRVSLSGLLNAIDGVTAPEGRLLIMTSNTPDTLDPALIRPGRIDKQVFFGHVSPQVASQIFMRMFTESPDEQFEEVQQVTDVDVPVLAKTFGEQVPEKLVTPAEVQCYLLDHRDDPVSAVQKTGAWLDRMVALKEKGTNVIEEAAAEATAGAQEGSSESSSSDEESLTSESDDNWGLTRRSGFPEGWIR